MVNLVNKKFLRNYENLITCISMRGQLDLEEVRKLNVAFSHLDDQKEFAVKLNKSELLSICHENLKSYFDHSTLAYSLEKYRDTEIKISLMFSELSLLGSHFLKKGLKVVALKNGGLAQYFLDDLGSHPMGDIDLMISKNDFLEAHDEIISAGFKLEFRSKYEENDISVAFKNGGAEYSKKIDNGDLMWLELSWRSVSGRWINQNKEPKADDLLSRVIPAPISGIYLLSPEDNLLQVAIHTAKHTYFRAPGIRLHLDVHRVCKLFEIDWQLFLQAVESSGTKTAVFFSLITAKNMLGTPIPDEIIEKIRPSFWKQLLFNFVFRSVRIGERFQPSRLMFIVFQASLYDDISSFFSVLIPAPEKVKKDGYPLIISYLIHILDLIGIRKKYRK